MAYPRYSRSRAFKFFDGDAAGDHTTTSTTMVAIDGTDYDLTLNECQVGDVVRLRFRGHVSNDSAANALTLNFYSVNNTAYVATQADGVWEDSVDTTPRTVEVVHLYTLVAGDLSSGAAQFEVHWATAGGTARLDNAAGTPLPQFSVENLGPVQS